MSYPIRKEQRRRYGRRLSVSFFCAAVCCLGSNTVLEYCYGPWEPFFAQHTLLAWSLAAVGLVVFFGVLIWFLVCLFGFLGWKGRLRRWMRRYLREDAGDPLALLEEDIYCRVMDAADCWLGKRWLVVPGRAMAREAVVGIYYEELGRKYLSNKVRIAIIDELGEMLYIDVPKKLDPVIYNYLNCMHPEASWGDIRAYRAFVLKEQQAGGQVDYRHLRLPVNAAPLGIAVRDRSPLLEDNRICCEYERWLLAAYAVYIAGVPTHYGSFDHAGGWERSEYQQKNALRVLAEPWDIHNKAELLDTVEHLRVTGKLGHDGWQLGRAPMVLGFGYIAGMLTRRELLAYSGPVAKAIQETFGSWKELHDSYMESYVKWAQGDKRSVKLRQRAYRELLRDSKSILNTVSFNLELSGRYREAMALIPRGQDDSTEDWEPKQQKK